MKTIIAMMLAAAFLTARPALADDAPAPKPKTEKKSKKTDKKAEAPSGAEPAPAPAPDKKTEKGGW
jgi:hypothetical protein